MGKLMEKVICIGDSLTKGMFGFSYIDYLDKKYIYINKGVNGDTIICVLERLKMCISDYPDVTKYIIAIGINDILVPYLAGLSPMWYKQCKVAKLNTCLTSMKDFKMIYETFVKLLKNNHKDVIIIGMPVIQLENFCIDEEIKRNKYIKLIAKKYHYKFIDAYNIQLKHTNKYNIISWNQKNFKVLFDYYIMATKPSSKEKLSEKRNLELTVDGVHYNETSAYLIASEINKKID